MMMSRSATRVARTMLAGVGPRYFSTAGRGAVVKRSLLGGGGMLHGSPVRSEKVVMTWMRFPARNATTVALGDKPQEEEKVGAGSGGAAAGGGASGDNNKAVMSYWGVEPAKITREDGSEWRWNCFRVRLIRSLN